MKGPFSGHRRTASQKNGGDSMGGGNCVDAPKPRLSTLHNDRRAAAMRDELSGEADRVARSKVTLPKFSWDKK